MKWSKNWVAAVMLLPAMYLASCGSGNNDADNTDTLSTQSAPPSDENSSTSDTRNMGDTSLSSSTTVDTSTSLRSGGIDVTGSATTGTTTESAKTGSTGATGNTGTSSGNTGVSSSERTGVASATGETRRSSTTGTKTRKYRKSSGAARRTTTTSDRTSTTSDRTSNLNDRTTSDRSSTTKQDTSSTVESTLDTAASRVRELGDTAANKMGELADSTARKLGRVGDTLASKANELVDTTAQRMDRLGDTAANRLRELGDTSTMSSNRWDSTATSEFDSTKGKQGNISGMTEKERTGNFADTTDPQNADSSRTMSTMGAGMNFTPSVFIPEQIRSNYAEIKLARMAIDKSQNDDVKQIARTLENDHNTLLRELQTLANNSSTGNDSLPTSENEMAKHHQDMMKNLTGQEFDRQWLQHMHMMHEQKVQMFEQAESNNSVQDAQLRIWMSKTLPTLRKHRDMLAQQLNSQNR